MCVYDEAILSGKMTARQIADKYVVDTCVVRARAKRLGVALPAASRCPAWHTKALELLAAGKTDSAVALRLGVTKEAVKHVRLNRGMSPNMEERFW